MVKGAGEEPDFPGRPFPGFARRILLRRSRPKMGDPAARRVILFGMLRILDQTGDHRCGNRFCYSQDQDTPPLSSIFDSGACSLGGGGSGFDLKVLNRFLAVFSV